MTRHFDAKAPTEAELEAANALPALIFDADYDVSSWSLHRLIRTICDANNLLWNCLYRIDDDGHVNPRWK